MSKFKMYNSNELEVLATIDLRMLLVRHRPSVETEIHTYKRKDLINAILRAQDRPGDRRQYKVGDKVVRKQSDEKL